MKKNLFIYLFISFFCVTAKSSITRSTCETRPNYDIIITSVSVQFIEKDGVLELFKNGQLKYNQCDVMINNRLSEKNAAFYEYVATEVPRFKRQLVKELANVHHYLNQIIQQRFVNNKHLLTYLARFHDRLKLALDETIVTQTKSLVFNHKAFNELKAKSETIANGLFTSAMSHRSINLEFIKNYAAINEIFNNKWNDEKSKLTRLYRKGCDMIKYIDAHYYALKAQVQTITQ